MVAKKASAWRTRRTHSAASKARLLNLAVGIACEHECPRFKLHANFAQQAKAVVRNGLAI